ncbi:MAG: hypothetical protein KF812_00685 [Fimbriimonadaceae bacterium]|nr:hypothetical protein [Fimbriimonadaceae bacterium]
MLNIAAFFLLVSSYNSPLKELAASSSFVIREGDEASSDGTFDMLMAHSEHLDVSFKSEVAFFDLPLIQALEKDIFFWPRRSESVTGDSLAKGSPDGNPIGSILTIGDGRLLRQVTRRRPGDQVEACFGAFDQSVQPIIYSQSARASLIWFPVRTEGRSATIGGPKEPLRSFVVAFMRWHLSEATGRQFEQDSLFLNGHTYAILKDKQGSTYLDVVELANRNQWPAKLNLSPATIDVTSAGGKVTIYPGADRVKLNDEVITLSGTVPTRGYGAFLPLEFLQQNGFVPQ